MFLIFYSSLYKDGKDITRQVKEALGINEPNN